jgi:hypothetical protein
MKETFRPQDTLMNHLKPYVDRETGVYKWMHQRRLVKDVREAYEANMMEIMNSLRPFRKRRLHEIEVFSGNIMIKKDRASTSALRKADNQVRERFDWDVKGFIDRIVRGDAVEDDSKDEALPRAIACFKVSFETED